MFCYEWSNSWIDQTATTFNSKRETIILIYSQWIRESVNSKYDHLCWTTEQYSVNPSNELKPTTSWNASNWITSRDVTWEHGYQWRLHVNHTHTQHKSQLSHTRVNSYHANLYEYRGPNTQLPTLWVWPSLGVSVFDPSGPGVVLQSLGCRTNCSAVWRKSLSDHSDVILKVPNCQIIQIFTGCVPDPNGGAYSTPQTPSWWGGPHCPPQEPHPLLSALRSAASVLQASLLQLKGLTHYRVGNLRDRVSVTSWPWIQRGAASDDTHKSWQEAQEINEW